MNRKIGLILLLAVLSGIMFASLSAVRNSVTITYSQFQSGVQAKLYAKVSVEGTTAIVKSRKNETFLVNLPSSDVQENLAKQLAGSNTVLEFSGDSAGKDSNMTALLALAVTGLIGIGAMLAVTFSRMTGGSSGGGMGGGFMQRPAPLAKLQKNITTRLTDVAGIDEVRSEVSEIIDFLRTPKEYQRLGAKIPKGVLMSGPPGTGKTLLARAIAGEAKVAFFTTSGSEFVEMYVGVGAKRVRDLFEQARQNAPCIVFIDEIDAVARKRGSTNNNESEQTLNQLLVEMDGFDESGVIVIAATNRPDVLDDAIGRRFTRKVDIGLPDVKGRQAILETCSRSRAIEASVDFSQLAKVTPGFSGAELEILVNEAALAAAREKAVYITAQHLENARDKAIMGIERKTTMSETELRNTAYHEAGHAVVGYVLGLDPVHKISIVPRGRALGVTVTLPDEDKYSSSRNELKGRIAMLYGGRVAEELFTKDITTGASNDYERATDIGYAYVARLGMSELGPLVVGPRNDESAYATPRHSQETQREVDLAVRKMLNEQYQVATDIIKANSDKMHEIVKLLMAEETINREQFEDIMKSNA